MSETLRSFAPVITRGARLLILGSMPGQRSLLQQQYYAHPQNVFWPFFCDIFSVSAGSYEERLQALVEHKLALWDVLASCKRSGSLDADIREPIANDIPALIEQYPSIRHIAFNGAAAASLFNRHFAKAVDSGELFAGIGFIKLPSSSPANASIKREDKLRCWREALQCAL